MEVKNLRNLGDELLHQGLKLEETAKLLHHIRRNLDIKYKDLTPEAPREYIYVVNINRYI